MGELLNYIDEFIRKDTKNDGLEIRCESTSPMSCAYNENEQTFCEDITFLRDGYLTNKIVHEHSMDMEGVT